jgi:hypothetical protein
MLHAFELLRANLPLTTVLCLIRALPFAIYAAASSRVAMLGKGLSGLIFVALALTFSWLGQDPVRAIASHAVAFGYLTLCALVVWALGSRVDRPSKLASAGLFSGLCVSLIALPGAILPSPADVLAVPLGFEMVFSSYSYWHDGRSLKMRPSMEEALFFLLINPALSYPERGQLVGPARLDLRGLRRCLLGALALGGHTLILALLTSSPSLRPPPLAALVDLRTDAIFLVHYTGRFFEGYARHSGGASLAIGAMLMLGYEIPERYNHPWRATSPADFWRRWNTYLGGWARRYLFFPLASSMQRRLRGRPAGNTLAKVVAVLGTFALIGVMHDFGVFAQNNRWPLGGLLVFGLNALALLVWVGAAHGLRALRDWLRVSRTVASSLVWSAISRICFLAFLLMTTWVAIPTMSTDFALTADDLLRWVGIAEHHAP